MSFEDEERIRARKQMRQMDQEAEEKKIEELGSIYDESLEIMGEKCTFSRRRIGNLPCSMYLPEQFTLLSEEVKEMVFVRTKSPDYAYAAEGLHFSMAVNLAESPLKREDIVKFLNVSGQLIETLVPQANVLRTYVTGTDEFPVGNAEFVSKGLDGMIYHFMMFISINEKLAVINQSMNYSFQKQLLPILKEMGESLRVEEFSDEADHI